MEKLFAALFFFPLLTLSQAATWDYSDTNWATNYPSCGGSRQSPINIDKDDVFGADYSDFTFSLNYKILQTGTIENDGHTLKFTVDESEEATISGGPLNGSFILHSFHLHWGSQNDQGSEHTLDGESFDAELHLVHYNSNYDNISAAIADNQTDSLAVVGIFIREVMPWDQFRGVMDSETITNLKMAANELSQPRRGPSAASTEMEVLLDQFTSAITDINGIFHYEGSLTTPGCHEIVQWIVLDKPLHVRKNGLLAALRKNLDVNGDALQDNFRPTQALNNRTVYYHSASEVAPRIAFINVNGSSVNATTNAETPVNGSVYMLQFSADSHVFIGGSINGLETGSHGFHIHQIGSTDNGCVAAGGHFNPYNDDHGMPNATERHVGDLGNIVTPGAGLATPVDKEDEIITLFDGAAEGIIGRTLVIHAGEDDFMGASGNAGSRVACGIVELVTDTKEAFDMLPDNLKAVINDEE